MNTLRKFILYFSLISLSACGVSNIPITLQKAPAISFTDLNTNILVINRFDVNKVDFFLRKEKKKEVYNRGINAEIAQLLNELENIKGISLIKKSDSLTMARNIKADLDSTVLTIGEIQTLASKYNADYILALENYDAGFVQNEVIKSKNGDGSTKKIAKYSLAVQSSWILYDKYGQSFKELKGNVAKYHSEREVLSALLAIGPALGSNTKFVQNVSMEAGNNIANYFKSQLITIERPLYTDKLFKPSVKAMQNRDFDLAKKQLEVLAKDADATISSKAYYNLAVMADLNGSKESAVDFAELSMQKKKNSYASSLLESFKYRDLANFLRG